MFLRACASVLRGAVSVSASLPSLSRRSTPLVQYARQFCDGAHQPIIFEIKTADEFHDHVLNSEVPVVVDFHADWCGPCQMLGPRLAEKINARGGQVVMAKINVDDAGELAVDWQVSAVPTVMAFHDGEVVSSFQGVVDDDVLDQFLDKAIEG